MLRLLGIALAGIILALVAYPFLQEAMSRHRVSQRLDAVMDSRDKAEFDHWTGDATSFARALYERCQARGGTPMQCDRYRHAYE
jgi:hypothetical protein